MANCDCVPGKYLCAEARRLWSIAMDCWEAWAGYQTEEEWRKYEKAKERYFEHVRRVGGE